MAKTNDQEQFDEVVREFARDVRTQIRPVFAGLSDLEQGILMVRIRKGRINWKRFFEMEIQDAQGVSEEDRG